MEDLKESTALAAAFPSMSLWPTIGPVESAVASQPNLPVSTAAHLTQMLELLGKLMDYRSSEVRHRLEKIGRAASVNLAHKRLGNPLVTPDRK